MDVRFIGQFCEPCAEARLRKRIAPIAEIQLCKFCNKIKNGLDFRKLGKGSLGFALRQAVKQKGCELKVLRFDGLSADLVVTCTVDGERLSFPYAIELKTEYLMCGQCSRKSSGYYEALVQLRGPRQQVETMKGALERFVERREGFISRIEKEEHGYDLYISDKAATSEFFLQRKLKPKRSYTLYGMKRGRKLYRNIYSITV